MSNKNHTIMVVPQWFPLDPNAIRALGYVGEQYNRHCKLLFQTQYLYEDVTLALQQFFMLEGICAAEINTIPHDNYHHVEMSKKFHSVLTMHVPDKPGFFTEKLLVRMKQKVRV